jgi:hypothetical protein
MALDRIHIREYNTAFRETALSSFSRRQPQSFLDSFLMPDDHVVSFPPDGSIY